MFAMLTVTVDRSRGMNNVLRRKPEPRCNNSFTSLNRSEFITSNLKFGCSRGFEYGFADAASHLEHSIRRIDYNINFYFSDVLSDYGKWHILITSNDLIIINDG
ncbi:hypothetical protein BRE01_17130 [Brevibacillus reuszeri]|uniref:Uncharacterized protein n=1 Tax=Brevibacillus reuszeri TaxID=54915 RepID=A0ABQ0TJG6_9BACL|nr:hypothetical protein BRE01_17130 [Brevibacillus reuszeri]